MTYFIKYIYSFLLPPGLFVLLLFILFCWTYNRIKNVSYFIGLICIIIYLLSTTLIGKFLTLPLEMPRQKNVDPSADVIVVLTEGINVLNGISQSSPATFMSLVTAKDIYTKNKMPIIISGGENESQVAKREIMATNISRNDIIIEDKSLNTNQQAVYTKLLLNKYGFKHPILIASPTHMERAILSFNKLNTKVSPYPNNEVSSKIEYNNVETYLPSTTGLSLTSSAIKEYLGKLDFRK